MVRHCLGHCPFTQEYSLAHQVPRHQTPFLSKFHLVLLRIPTTSCGSRTCRAASHIFTFAEDVASVYTSLPLSVHRLWPSTSLSSSVRYFLIPLSLIDPLFISTTQSHITFLYISFEIICNEFLSSCYFIYKGPSPGSLFGIAIYSVISFCLSFFICEMEITIGL